MNVLLIDAKTFPRRKACGGCLNKVSVGLVECLLPPDIAEQLWNDSIALKKFCVFHHQRDFSAELIEGGFAVDRARLDHALVREAEKLGVKFLSPATAKLANCNSDGRNVEVVENRNKLTVTAKAVVIACGLGNRVANGYPQFQQTPAENSRVGVEAIYETFPNDYRSGVLSMAIGDCGYVGLTHIGNQRLHVAAAVDRSTLQKLGPQATVDRLMQQSGAPPLSQPEVAWKGTPPLTSIAESVAGDRVFLVGDAASYVEPFTGEGIRWALQSGIGVAPFVDSAVNHWQDKIADDYQHWYRGEIQSQQKLCRRLSAGLKKPVLRWAAHQALRLRPSLADSIIKRLNS